MPLHGAGRWRKNSLPIPGPVSVNCPHLEHLLRGGNPCRGILRLAPSLHNIIMEYWSHARCFFHDRGFQSVLKKPQEKATILNRDAFLVRTKEGGQSREWSKIRAAMPHGRMAVWLYPFIILQVIVLSQKWGIPHHAPHHACRHGRRVDSTSGWARR